MNWYSSLQLTVYSEEKCEEISPVDKAFISEAGPKIRLQYKTLKNLLKCVVVIHEGVEVFSY